ncbi:hypothetical protein IV203_037813 [Nitzschia inconspicua]|uniref:Uncharacterized protein n=1 Tax=Nitzschia inconspicua TaxID=303405 RepID=A0A9K3LPN0_9STRA|nr:hypothetical protein IV203_037813 [Nitzschia inconspicua]
MPSSPPRQSLPSPPPRPHTTPSGLQSTKSPPSVPREPLVHENGESGGHNNALTSLSLSPAGSFPSIKASISSRGMMSTSMSTALTSESPLKAAATLIQSLDIAHTEMSSFAADAARDAESARRNARAAHEIARRYQNRSYPKTKSSFEDITVLALSTRKTSGSTPYSSKIAHGSSTSDNGATTAVTPRPKPPKMKPLNLQLDEPQSYQDGDNDNVIIAIATDLKTPSGKNDQTPQNGKKHVVSSKEDDTMPTKASSSTTVNNNRKSRGFHTPSSVERIAQHHADDMLQLSLELERIKQELKSEQRMHQECKTALASMHAKTSSLEAQNHKLLQDLETERRQSTQQLSQLQQEVTMGRLRLQAAEEDAQLALDLAKDSSDQRDQLEEQLQKALEEIHMLKANAAQAGATAMMNGGNHLELTVDTPRRHVRFADSQEDTRHDHNEGKTPESAFGTPLSLSSPTPSRALVALGRQVLRRQTTPEDMVIHQFELTPAKSAERRMRLRQRLTELDAVIEASASGTSSPYRGFTPTNSPLRLLTSSASTTNDAENIAVKKKLEEYYAAFKILQTSGKRLDMDGYWFRDNTPNPGMGNNQALSHPVQLDVMTRQYCQNVEFKLDRQKKEINELESLCGYLEKKLITDNN